MVKKGTMQKGGDFSGDEDSVADKNNAADQNQVASYEKTKIYRQTRDTFFAQNNNVSSTVDLQQAIEELEKKGEKDI